MRTTWAGAVVVGLMLAGCSSGSSSHVAAATTPTPAPSATHAPGGIVGTIDRARLLSVCENVRTADTAVIGGDNATVDTAVSSSVTLLLKPPVDTDAQSAGRLARRLVAQGHREQAVAALALFCRRHNA